MVALGAHQLNSVVNGSPTAGSIISTGELAVAEFEAQYGKVGQALMEQRVEDIRRMRRTRQLLCRAGRLVIVVRTRLRLNNLENSATT